MNESNGLSAADIMALTKNNTEGMSNGGYFWWVIIFLIIAAMFGGNGFGFGNNGATNALIGEDEFIKRDIFNTNQNISNTAAKTQNDILASSCQTQRDVLDNKYNLGMNIMENRYANQLGVQQVISSQKDCCCSTKQEIAQNRYDNALGQANLQKDMLLGQAAAQKDMLLGNKDLQAQMAQCCCDLKTAVHAEGEATRALITENTIQELRDRLAVANSAIASQAIANGVIDAVRPYPVPAYPVSSPYGTTSYPYGYNYGVSTVV